jgi:hypothetical protein
MKKIIITTLLAILLISCSSNIVKYTYSFEEAKSQESDFKYEEILYGRYRYLYSDKNIELLFDFDPNEIGIQVKNPSMETIRIIWDNVYLETDFDPIKKFNLSHTNRLQEDISLSDSTVANYEKSKLIKQKQKEDTIYITKPTIVLPGMTFSDVIVNKERGFFMPYEMKDETILSNSASAMKDKNIILHFSYKVNSKLINTSFRLRIKDYSLLQKG